MTIAQPRKPIYLMTSSVFFVGCTVSQANALAAVSGLGSAKGASWAGLKSYTRIELPLSKSGDRDPDLDQYPC